MEGWTNAMGDHRRRSCKSCGRDRDECGGISWTGLCLDCAQRRMARNIEGIANREGLPYRRWLLGVAEYAHGALLDASEEHGQTASRAD